DDGALHSRHRQRAARRDRRERMRRQLQDPCSQSGAGRSEGRRLSEDPTARIPTLIDPEGPGGKPFTVTQSWAILMYLCEKTGTFLPADPVARVRMFQWLAEGAADYASVNQTIFFLGARMPEKVPDSAVKFYEDRFVNLWRFADAQLAQTQYLAGNEITAAD